MTPEEKVIEKIRSVLLADSVIKGYVSTRIYSSHISTIVKPVYPAISIHMLNSNIMPSTHEVVIITLQLDAWLLKMDYDDSDLMAIQKRFRALLHEQTITDTGIGIKGECRESESGPLMVEEDTGLIHRPVRYLVMAL